MAVKDRPSAAPSGGSGFATPAPADKAGKVRGHFKTHGICKFGGDKKCRKFKKSADGAFALPAPNPISALDAGDSEDANVRECRRCKKSFTESSAYCIVTLKMDTMPWHCGLCRALNKEEKKGLKAANETAAIQAVIPLIEIAGADSEDTLADANANHWNGILNWEDECNVRLMIVSSVQGGPDRVWDVSHNQVAECSPFFRANHSICMN